MESSENDLLQRADDLDTKIKESQPAFEELLQYTHRTRWLTKIALTLILVGTVMLLILLVVVVRVWENTGELTRNTDRLEHLLDIDVNLADGIQVACEADNRDKQGTIELWNFMLDNDIVPPDHTEAVRAIVNRIFEPADCASLIGEIPKEPSDLGEIPVGSNSFTFLSAGVVYKCQIAGLVFICNPQEN